MKGNYNKCLFRMQNNDDMQDQVIKLWCLSRRVPNKYMDVFQDVVVE